MKLKRM